MLWIKAFHIVFMVTWFAGLFYLPRLFVYHAMSQDETSLARFRLMERKLYYGIMTPGAVLTIASGATLWWVQGYAAGWLRVKIGVVVVLVIYHLWCGKLMHALRDGRSKRTHVWFRWFNEVPVVFLLGIVVLAVVKPF